MKKDKKKAEETPAERRARERGEALAAKQAEKTIAASKRNAEAVIAKLEPAVAECSRAIAKDKWQQVPDVLRKPIEAKHTQWTEMIALATSALDAGVIVHGIDRVQDHGSNKRIHCSYV